MDVQILEATSALSRNFDLSESFPKVILERHPDRSWTYNIEKADYVRKKTRHR